MNPARRANRLGPDAAKRAIRRRFRRALQELQRTTALTAKQFSGRYQLPHRTVLHWLAGTACPGPRRLKELCVRFGWGYETMFQGQALVDEQFEAQYLDYEALTERYLRMKPRDPLEAWGHVPLAGALVFVDLSASGFECRAITDQHFGTRIQFMGSERVALQIQVVFQRGLVISWLDDQGLIRETLDLSTANLNALKARLRSVAGL